MLGLRCKGIENLLLYGQHQNFIAASAMTSLRSCCPNTRSVSFVANQVLRFVGSLRPLDGQRSHLNRDRTAVYSTSGISKSFLVKNSTRPVATAAGFLPGKTWLAH